MQGLERNPLVFLATRKEAWLPWGKLSSSLRSPSQLKRNLEIPIATLQETKVPTSTRDEAQFSYTDPRAIQSSPSQLKRRPDCPELTQEVPWGPHCNSIGSPSFPPQVEINHISPSLWDEARFSCSALRAILSYPLQLKTPFWQLERFTEIPVTTQEEPRVCCLNSRRTPCFSPYFEMRANSPASAWEESQLPLAPQKEACLTSCNSTGSHSSLSQLTRNPILCHSPRSTTTSPLQFEIWPNSPAMTREESRVPLSNSARAPQPWHKGRGFSRGVIPPQLERSPLLEPERKPHTTTKREAHPATNSQ